MDSVKRMSNLGQAFIASSDLVWDAHVEPGHSVPLKVNGTGVVVISEDVPSKIYQLFGSPGGGLSAKTVDYRGESIDVLAHSVKQAYHLAGNSKWPSGPGEVGIVQYYRRDHGVTLWDGSWTSTGLSIKHGSSWTSTKQAMQDHLNRTRKAEG